MTERFSVTIRAPIERVWHLIDDPAQLSRWMEGLVESRDLDGAGASRRVGTRFVQRIREGGRETEYQGAITDYEPPSRLGLTIGNRIFAMRVLYRLERVAEGTRLDYSAGLERGGAFVRVMSSLFGWLTRRILRRQMARLTALAEAPITQSPA